MIGAPIEPANKITGIRLVDKLSDCQYWNNRALGMIGATIEPANMITGIRLVHKLSGSRAANVIWLELLVHGRRRHREESGIAHSGKMDTAQLGNAQVFSEHLENAHLDSAHVSPTLHGIAGEKNVEFTLRIGQVNANSWGNEVLVTHVHCPSVHFQNVH